MPDEHYKLHSRRIQSEILSAANKVRALLNVARVIANCEKNGPEEARPLKKQVHKWNCIKLNETHTRTHL